jgi:hypothetical protein
MICITWLLLWEFFYLLLYVLHLFCAYPLFLPPHLPTHYSTTFPCYFLWTLVFFSLRSGRPKHRGEVCSAHVTIRSSPLPLLLSTIALQSILPPFNSTCNQLYALQRAVRIERAAPGHPARPPQLQRTSPLERASSRLPATLLCTPPEYIRAPAEPAKQRSPATSSSTTENSPPSTQLFPLVLT